MSAPGSVDALLARLAAGELAPGIRLAAARGALPLAPADLLRVQAHLAGHDPDDQVRSAASAALLERDPDEVAEILAGEGLSAEAAAFYAAAPATDVRILEALVANAACDDALVARLAASAVPRVIEALLLNQMRLIGSPAVLEGLEANPALSPGQRGRLAEVRRHLQQEAAEALDPVLAAEMEAAAREAEEEEARLAASSARGAAAAPAPAEEAAADPGHPGEPAESGLSTYQRILRMNPTDKVKLAYRGSAEERALLIRDANRVVARSVLRSPRLSEKEVENFANMRSISDEVLRAIGANREWLKSYTVALGLARNPKTPPGTALPLLQRLTNRDLNILAGDRNVTEVIRQTARRAFVARTAGRAGGR